ncbi:MAG TPA: hypothetical protein VHU91_08255 [Mycobacteriales bacterium]|jgi:protein-tyrosine phosphatase|nr:hypothetical protein [Mycobacteriales bacterium]
MTDSQARAAAAPFTVLHICLGNICRSPMAERLLATRFAQRVTERDPGASAGVLLVSHSAGTGDWHVGQSMQSGSTRQLARLGIASDGFRARTLDLPLLERTDLVLTATGQQAHGVGYLDPSLRGRVFPLLPFARYAGEVAARVIADATDLEITAAGVRARGEALIHAVAERAAQEAPDYAEDVVDPYGSSDGVFAAVADTIDRAVAPLAAVLAGVNVRVPDKAVSSDR